MSDEPVSAAEKDLPSNLCPLIKSSYGFAKEDKCPYFHFSDVVVGETTCDGKKKMYELMGKFKNMYLMQLPQAQDADSFELWKKEVQKFRDYLADFLGTEISDEKLEEAIHLKNEEREAMRKFSELMMSDPAPISGLELFQAVYGSTFKFDKKELIKDLDDLRAKVEEEYKNGRSFGKRPRIIITGCPMGGDTLKVVRAVEDNGGVVVAYENCSGYKNFDRLVKENTGDPISAIADRYMQIGCSVMTPNDNRLELLGRLIDQYHADGVIDMELSACHTYAIETATIRDFCNNEKDLPYLAIETDYSKADIGQLNTRITAFIEMLD
ncbi:MAG: double-cubane-cluster-containing anaerobic reductase, partial [Eubacterium sp.]